MHYLFFILLIVLIFSGHAFALKCDKCHKDDKTLNKILQERGIKSKDDLFNVIRNGKMSRLHKNLTDEEITEASKLMDLK